MITRGESKIFRVWRKSISIEDITEIACIMIKPCPPNLSGLRLIKYYHLKRYEIALTKQKALSTVESTCSFKFTNHFLARTEPNDSQRWSSSRKKPRFLFACYRYVSYQSDMHLFYITLYMLWIEEIQSHTCYYIRNHCSWKLSESLLMRIQVLIWNRSYCDWEIFTSSWVSWNILDI